MAIYCPLSEALGIEYIPTNEEYDETNFIEFNEGRSAFEGKKHTEETRIRMSQIHRDRTKRGLNPLSGGLITRKSNADRIAKRTHNWLGPETNRKRLKEGTHNFLESGFQSRVAKDAAKKLLAEGRFQTDIEYTCPHCGKIGKGNGMKRWHFDKCKEK